MKEFENWVSLNITKEDRTDPGEAVTNFLAENPKITDGMTFEDEMELVSFAKSRYFDIEERETDEQSELKTMIGKSLKDIPDSILGWYPVVIDDIIVNFVSAEWDNFLVIPELFVLGIDAAYQPDQLELDEDNQYAKLKPEFLS